MSKLYFALVTNFISAVAVPTSMHYGKNISVYKKVILPDIIEFGCIFSMVYCTCNNSAVLTCGRKLLVFNKIYSIPKNKKWQNYYKELALVVEAW